MLENIDETIVYDPTRRLYFVHEDIIDNNGNEFIFNDTWKLRHVVFRTGKFTSLSQATRSGWDGHIPKGYSCFIIGRDKRKTIILHIYNKEI